MDKEKIRSDELRRKAEKLLRAGSFEKPKADDTDTQSLLEELLIYQVELEVQNGELRETQGALEISRNRYFELFDLAPVGYLTLDRHGVIVEANFTSSEMLGVGRSFLKNTTFSGLIATGYQEIFFRHLDKVLTSKSRANCEIQLRKSAGDTFHVRLTSSFIESSTESQACMLSTLVDLTESKRAEEALRKSEKKYRAVVEGSREGIGIIQDGEITFVNPALAGILGQTEAELQGKKFSDFIRPESSIPNWLNDDQCDETILSGQPLKASLLKSNDNSDRHVEITSSMVEWEGKPGLLTFVSDVTDRENLQNLLLRSQKLEALGVLAGGIAHDFNNLLHMISGHTELLMMNKNNLDTGYKNLQAIVAAVERGAGLVKQILAFGRRIDSNRRPTDLNEVVERSVSLIRNTIHEGIIIETLLDSNLKIINGDSSQLEQIIVNLCLNARDAMPNGGNLKISTTNIDVAESHQRNHPDLIKGHYVMLTVSDSGEGIPNAQIEHIFDPFFTTRQPGKGSGLGLSAVFGIVRSHKGHITCETELEKGTTFSIFFPVFESEDSIVAVGSPEPCGSKGRTILFADDEIMVREFVERLLDSSGYNVISVSSGVEAIKTFRDQKDHISLIILDLMMPDMGGKQCLTEILAIDPHAKVIVASGYSTELDAQDALAAGAKGFLGKPFKVSDLLVKISSIIQS